MTLQDTLESLTAHALSMRIAQLPVGKRPQRKADMVAAISGCLLSDALADIVARLSEPERNAVAEAVHHWDGRFRPVAFDAKYGKLPSFFTRDPYRFPRQPEPPSALEVLLYDNRVPDDLAARLAPLLPAPPPLDIPLLDDEQLPAAIGADEDDDKPEPLERRDTEPMVHHDLPAVLHLVARGGVAVGAKTGIVSAAGARRIEAVLQGGDWYSADRNADTPRWAGVPLFPIRAHAWPLLLQTGGLAKIDGSRLALTPKGKKALAQPVHEVVADLYTRWRKKGAPDELRRVEMIKGQTARGVRLTAPVDRRLVIENALHVCCPVGQWLSVDDLFRLMKIDGFRFEVAGNLWKLYLTDANYGTLGYDGSDFEILEGRYTLAYLFEYLATLGLVDVAYTLPHDARPDYHGHWGTDELEYLSRYDGLRYLRLTPLGAYCLGLVDSYAPAPLARAPLFRVGPDLSLALLRPAEPAEQLQLEQIATRVSAERWQLDAEALLARGSDAEERARNREFLTTALDGTAPPELGELLDGIDQRATAVTDLGPARLIQCRDAALAGLLADDPATSAHCSRAGERLLCVPEKKLAAFRKGLARLGFVLPGLGP